MAQFTDIHRFAYADRERHEVFIPFGYRTFGLSLSNWIENPDNGLTGAYGIARQTSGLLFWFTDADAAFAFKMRWA